MANDETRWNGPQPNDIDIEIDLDVLAKKLVANQQFVDNVANKVRKALTRNVRSYGNVFGKWAGR